MAKIDTFLQNVYTGPARDRLEHRVRGQFKITGVEIESHYAQGQDAFIATIQATFVDTLDAMIDAVNRPDPLKDHNHERGEFPQRKRQVFFFTVNGHRYVSVDLNHWERHPNAR